MKRHNDPPEAPAAQLGRRHVLQLGGLTVAASAALAACGDKGQLGRVGLAPPTTKLPDAVVDDVVYLRTASSIEHTIIGVYDRVIADPTLIDPTNLAAAQRFRDDHREHAALYERLTTQIGGVAWKAPNPRLEETVVTPGFNVIKGAKSPIPEVADTPPSDDPERDAIHLLHGFETIAAESYQALVPQLSRPALREQAIGVAARSARRSALLAIAIAGRPQGYVIASDIPTSATTSTTPASSTTAQDIAGATTTTAAPANQATPIPPVYAITTQFGGLAPITLVLGAPNESGTRTSIILDTPSLNTFVYEYMHPPAG